MRRKCSLTAMPEPTQRTRANGNRTANSAVHEKALDDQPPHLRYQPKRKARLTIQVTNRVTPIQSIRRGNGRGGRSGLMKRCTSGMARSAAGTLTQKTQRHDSASLTSAVKSGVVGREAYASTP